MVKRCHSEDRVLEPLPLSYVPTENDVICARGKVAIKHEGNKRFMEICKKFLKRYAGASTKVDKSGVVSEIIATVVQGSKFGGFVKKVGEKWFIADEQLQREKVSQALRNLLHGKYKSSTKAKKAQRAMKESQFDNEVDYALNQINCGDMVQRVEKLTAKARTEDDFQAAFLQVNIELLQRIKMIQPLTVDSSSVDDDEEPLPLTPSSSNDMQLPLRVESDDMTLPLKVESDDTPLPLGVDNFNFDPIPFSGFASFPYPMNSPIPASSY